MTATPATPRRLDGAAPGAARRPGTARPPPSALSVSLTFAWRGLLKIKHVPEQLGDVIGIPILFTLMFTYLFGGALAGSTGDYLQFLLPGTLVMAVLLVSVYTGVTLNTDIARGVFDRFRSLPIWRPAPIVGGLLGDVGRYLLAAALVIGLGLAMGFRPDGGSGRRRWPRSRSSSSSRSACPGSGRASAWCCAHRTPCRTSACWCSSRSPSPATSSSTRGRCPRWLRAFVDVNPISHLVTATRGLMDGTATATQVGWVLAASAVLTAVFAPLTFHLYEQDR